MPRPPRIEFAGAAYHVTNRGVERRRIVSDDTDRHTWFRLLDRVASRCGWRVFAYVLLDNHFHLFLQTPEPNLSRGMHDWEGSYAMAYNERHQRSGALFQSRFKATIVDREGYGWALSRYIHLNPVRAGVSADPAHYRWSSYRHFLNPTGAPSWLDWRTVLAEIGGSEGRARVMYRRFVDAGIAEPPDDPLRGRFRGQALQNSILPTSTGGDPNRDVAKLNFEVPDPSSFDPVLSVDQVVTAVSAAFHIPADRLSVRGRHHNRARDAAILLSRELLGVSLAELGQRFGGLQPSAVCESERRSRRRLETDSAFRELVQDVRTQLQGSDTSKIQFCRRALTTIPTMMRQN